MAVSLKHKFNCAKSDGTDVTAVKPSNWNDEHQLTAAAGKVLGTSVGSTTVIELPIQVDSTLQSMTPPSGNTASRPATPTSGMMRLNTTTGLLEAYLNSAWGGIDAFPSGTRMLFQQTNAPVGWTKDTSQNDKALRVVSGAAGSGGSVGFSSAFSNQATSSSQAGGTVWGHALTWGQMPAHQHYAATGAGGTGTGGGVALSGSNVIKAGYNGSLETDYILKGYNGVGADQGLTSSAGANEAHSHGFTGDWHSHTMNLAVQYVDLIIAQKN